MDKVSQDMEMASYISLSMVILLLSFGLTSFLVGICFHRVNKGGKLVKNHQVMPLKIPSKERKKFDKIKKDEKNVEEFDENRSEMSERKPAIVENDGVSSKGRITLESQTSKIGSSYGKSTKSKTGDRRENRFMSSLRKK